LTSWGLVSVSRRTLWRGVHFKDSGNTKSEMIEHRTVYWSGCSSLFSGTGCRLCNRFDI